MKTLIGMTSARSDQYCAKVWNRKLPVPMTATKTISAINGLSLRA